MKLRTLPLTLALMTAFAGTAQAQSLAILYEAAKSHDATFKAARWNEGSRPRSNRPAWTAAIAKPVTA